MSVTRTCLRLVTALLTCAFTTGALAQAYPTKSITLIVAVQAGTAGDLVGRVLADAVGAKLGQRIVVENVVGAGGAIGAQRVARGNPDGYVLGLFNSGVHAILPNLGSPLSFDPWKDLTAVTSLVETASVLIARPTLKAKSLSELIVMAKQEPGKLNYASVGHGSPQHMAMEQLKADAGIDITHVPYRGGSQATLAVSQGEVDVFWINTSVALPFIQAGTVRPLAVGSRSRLSIMPDVPTVREQGLPKYEYTGLFTLCAPSLTPIPILDKLNNVFSEALGDPKMIELLTKRGFVPRSSTRTEVIELLREENRRTVAIMQRIGLIRR